MHFTAQKVHLPLLLKPCFEIVEPLSLVLGPDTCVNSVRKAMWGMGTNYINISHESIKALRVLMGTAVFKRSSLQIGRFLV